METKNQHSVKIIECPRDAMQGLRTFIPTQKKVEYIQFLLNVGFDTIDFGSFVSPKVIPQMADTQLVIEKLDVSKTRTKLLAIVANQRGADEALCFEKIHYLGFPLSISENFQMRNTHKTISESMQTIDYIKNQTEKFGKELVVYLSMGFGNPYGDPWNEEIVEYWVAELVAKNIQIISLSDTVGSADNQSITNVFSHIIKKYPNTEFGAHFHTTPERWHEKVHSAYLSGCRRFDGTLRGYGGCPMAKDELVGNMPTEKLVSYFQQMKVKTNLNLLMLESCYNESMKLFK